MKALLFSKKVGEGGMEFLHSVALKVLHTLHYLCTPAAIGPTFLVLLLGTIYLVLVVEI